MAIDTQNRRRSVQAYTFGLVRPVPDAVIDIGDRATLGWFYRGLIQALVNLVAPKVLGGWWRGLEFRVQPGEYNRAVADNDATYQWYKNGAAIAGATGHNLSVLRSEKGSTFHFTETVEGVTTASDQVLVTNHVLTGYLNRGR